MSRADDIRARAEAEVAVAEAEDALIAAKDAGAVTPELKADLRAARQAYRELTAGAGTANPATIEAKGEVN